MSKGRLLVVWFENPDNQDIVDAIPQSAVFHTQIIDEKRIRSVPVGDQIVCNALAEIREAIGKRRARG